MARRSIDDRASTITIRTRAKGLLARFAHDLELEAEGGGGEVDLDGDSWSAELSFPVRKLRCIGAIKKGRVDFDVLSRDDISDIEKKIREEVLVGSEVKVTAKGSDRKRAEVTIVTPGGRQRLSCGLKVDGGDGAEVVVGNMKGSLRALGVREIKGPLGAFKVDDGVELEFRVKLKSPE